MRHVTTPSDYQNGGFKHNKLRGTLVNFEDLKPSKYTIFAQMILFIKSCFRRRTFCQELLPACERKWAQNTR